MVRLDVLGFDQNLIFVFLLFLPVVRVYTCAVCMFVPSRLRLDVQQRRVGSHAWMFSSCLKLQKETNGKGASQGPTLQMGVGCAVRGKGWSGGYRAERLKKKHNPQLTRVTAPVGVGGRRSPCM